MRIDIITLFPEFFDGLKNHSIIGRAIGSGKIELVTHNLRDYSTDKYKSVDDKPYGGGSGMVLRVDVVVSAIEGVMKKSSDHSPKITQGSELLRPKVILLTPQGAPYNQRVAATLSKEQNLILVCGHYEGFDERIRDYVDLEISVGDYVLTGGEIPAMIIADSVARLLPGVLGDDYSSREESFSDDLLEYPHYTRPTEYRGKAVPEVLTSGNHANIDEWRKSQAIERTKMRRPDLINEL